MIVVTAGGSNQQEAWEQYVAQSPTLHHAFLWEWREVIRAVFRHTPHYLLAEERGRVCGVLPLFLIESRLFGRALLSMPYLNGGGIAADSAEAFSALMEAAVQRAAELRVDYLELRHREAALPSHNTTPVKRHKVGVVLPLPATQAELFSSFPAKLRSQIRKPSKAGLRFELALPDPRALALFYPVFAENMRDLGTPVYPRALFEQTGESFPKQTRVALVWHQEKVVAGGVLLSYGNTVEIPWASSLRRLNHLSGNMLLYWGAMAAACDGGFERFDFGRSSPDSGTYRFKAQWGGTPIPLHWYYPFHNGSLPDLSPQSPRYQRAVQCWRKLPLAVTNTVGPWLTRGLP